MPEQNDDIKSRLNDVFIALKRLFSKRKVLDQETVEAELVIFSKKKKYNPNDENFDIEEFKAEFIKYLKSKGYDFSDVDASLIPAGAVNEQESVVKKLKNVHRISENLNEHTSDLTVFVDTTKMMPGLICYTIEQIEPNDKKPYVTYRPTPRVITQVHDSGVNQGTVFLTYDHKFVKDPHFGKDNSYNVIAETDVIYSPLTKEQAGYICRLLNIQSRQVYLQNMKKIECKKQVLLLKQQKTPQK